MSELETYSPNQNLPETVPKTLIYRGISKAHEGDRAGVWWSTDPYYALTHSQGTEGSFFVAIADNETLARLAKDASIEAEFDNYTFSEDPPGLRLATQDEIDALKDATTILNGGLDIPGGGRGLMMHPENAIEIGQNIFGPKDVGSLEVPVAVDVPREAK